jgi:outer membrane protein assembly factor BamB
MDKACSRSLELNPYELTASQRKAALEPAARRGGWRHFFLLPVLFALWIVPRFGIADDWPQWRGPNRDGIWRESGILQKFSGPQIELKWRAPVGPGYSGPTVANGLVYLTDRQVEPREMERVLCFDAESGESRWTHAYPCDYGRIGYAAGPRACVTVSQGRAYALGAAGNLHCLDASSGELFWARDLNNDFRIRMPNWGIAAAPLLVDDVIVLQIGGADGACIVALDKVSGAERWRALEDRASYSAPILIQQAEQPVAVVWTGDSVSGLDPATGKIHWCVPFPAFKMPIGVATPVVHGRYLFVSSFYSGSLMIQLDEQRLTATKLWSIRGRNERRTEALHCMISTPRIIGDFIYGVDSYGELRCLDARTGERIWEDQTATPRARWSNIHMVQHEIEQQDDRTWMFNERGDLLISRLSPQGFTEISRTHLIDPTKGQLSQRGGVCWSHPAFADRHVFARNDRELVCASLAE